MSYKALIFDFFDVIHVDFFQTWLRNHGMPREGAVHEASVELDHGRTSPDDFIDRLSEITGQQPSAIQVEFDQAGHINQELVDLIGQLCKTYKIAVLSNGHSDVVRSFIRKYKLQPLFHAVIVSSELGVIKPDPEIFRHTLAKLGVQPAEAVFIDDNLNNVAGAEAVGITGIRFTDTPSLRADLHHLGIDVPH